MTQQEPSKASTASSESGEVTLDTFVNKIDISKMSDDELDGIINKVRDGRRKMAAGPPPKKPRGPVAGVKRRKNLDKVDMMSADELESTYGSVMHINVRDLLKKKQEPENEST